MCLSIVDRQVQVERADLLSLLVLGHLMVMELQLCWLHDAELISGAKQQGILLLFCPVCGPPSEIYPPTIGIGYWTRQIFDQIQQSTFLCSCPLTEQGLC